VADQNVELRASVLCVYNSYMVQVNIATLKNHLSRHLAHVKQGGEIVVVDRDTPVARIIPFGPAADAIPGAKARPDDWAVQRLAELERQGLVTRGDAADVASWVKRSRPVTLPKGSPSAVALLLEERRKSTR